MPHPIPVPEMNSEPVAIRHKGRSMNDLGGVILELLSNVRVDGRDFAINHSIANRRPIKMHDYFLAAS